LPFPSNITFSLSIYIFPFPSNNAIASEEWEVEVTQQSSKWENIGGKETNGMGQSK